LGFLIGGDSPNFLTVIEPAQLPLQPVSPNVELNVALAALVGLVLAVGAALMLEYIDDTVKSTDDMSTSLKLTALGSVNRIKGKGYKDKLIAFHNPFSPLTEAYRGLRTNIQFMAVDQPAKSILITSSNPGEGKSVTAANLSIIMAQAFLKTILVDADLRQPNIHKFFGIPNKKGLTDLIRLPEIELEECLTDTGIENLQVLTSGSLPPNPAEILGSQRLVELLQYLEERADVIIFDSPPVMAVTDAVVLSSQVDGVILVVKAKRTRHNIAQEAIKRLQQVGANVMGGVLNQVPGRKQYNSSHYKYTDTATTKRRWWQSLNVSKQS
jgi:non-specific protein-tyrosine kinase